MTLLAELKVVAYAHQNDELHYANRGEYGIVRRDGMLAVWPIAHLRDGDEVVWKTSDDLASA